MIPIQVRVNEIINEIGDTIGEVNLNNIKSLIRELGSLYELSGKKVMGYKTDEEWIEIFHANFIIEKDTLLWNVFKGKVRPGSLAGSLIPEWKQSKSYRMVMVNKKQFPVAEVIFGMTHGYIPARLGYWNGDTEDTRIDNLADVDDFDSSRGIPHYYGWN